jgi:hypothetical protein
VEAGLSAQLHDAGELGIVGGFFGAVAFFSTFEWCWLLAAVVLLANWPYTIVVIVLTNASAQPDVMLC